MVKLLSSCSSLMCWVTWNYKRILKPREWVWLAWIRTLKQPSAEANPANQLGSWIFWCLTLGLGTGTTWGKANFCLFERPLFEEPFRAAILLTPSSVRCSAHPLSIERGWDEHHVPLSREGGGDAMFFIFHQIKCLFH